MSCGPSSILPNGACSVLPDSPFDGQVFIDNQLVRWIYHKKSDSWDRSGSVEQIPLADENTVGYLRPRDKALLDSIPSNPGGFGIIADTKLIAKTPDNPDGVLQGDIILRSNSLDIQCVDIDEKPITRTPTQLECVAPIGPSPGLRFKLSQKFINSLILDMPGKTGAIGATGPKGPEGKVGYAGGPAGQQGQPGRDIDQLSELQGIIFRDLDGITDTAAVDMEIIPDPGGCRLVVTKAKLNVPGTSPARQVFVSRLDRDIIYSTDPNPLECDLTRLSEWRLSKGPDDTTPMNLNLLRLADTDDFSEPMSFNGNLTLKTFINGFVERYSELIRQADVEYGRQARQYVEQLDDKARRILSQLADELARCEFNLPATQYCITFQGCDQPDTPKPPPLSVNPGKTPPSRPPSDLPSIGGGIPGER